MRGPYAGGGAPFNPGGPPHPQSGFYNNNAGHHESPMRGGMGGMGMGGMGGMGMGMGVGDGHMGGMPMGMGGMGGMPQGIGMGMPGGMSRPPNTRVTRGMFDDGYN